MGKLEILEAPIDYNVNRLLQDRAVEQEAAAHGWAQRVSTESFFVNHNLALIWKIGLQRHPVDTTRIAFMRRVVMPEPMNVDHVFKTDILYDAALRTLIPSFARALEVKPEGMFYAVMFMTDRHNAVLGWMVE